MYVCTCIPLNLGERVPIGTSVNKGLSGGREAERERERDRESERRRGRGRGREGEGSRWLKERRWPHIGDLLFHGLQRGIIWKPLIIRGPLLFGNEDAGGMK